MDLKRIALLWAMSAAMAWAQTPGTDLPKPQRNATPTAAGTTCPPT